MKIETENDIREQINHKYRMTYSDNGTRISEIRLYYTIGTAYRQAQNIATLNKWELVAVEELT